MCNSKTSNSVPSANKTPDELKKRSSTTLANLNPTKKCRLAESFIHNPKFAEAFFKARIGEEGMIRFRALKSHISQMPDEGLKCITDQRVVGTLTLLSKFFDPTEPEVSVESDVKDTGDDQDGETKEGGKEVERVKMNKWCWAFLGAWTIGEAGRVLEGRKQIGSKGEVSAH